MLSGGGAMGARIRSFDWAATELGVPADWPEALKTLVGVMLGSRQPMFTAWGPRRLTLYNDGYAEMMGAKHPAGLGEDFLSIWHEAHADLEPLMSQVFAGTSVYMDDLELHLDRGGQPGPSHFAFSWTPVRDADGGVVACFCACTEITAQVLVDQVRAADAVRQRRLFENAPGFICILNGPDHVFEFVNATYVRLFGPRDFIGLTIREVFPDVAEQGYYELLDKVYATGVSAVFDHSRVVLKTGEMAGAERFFDFICEPIVDEAGVVTGIFCQGTDVTGVHRAEQSLRATEAELRRLDGDVETEVAVRTFERGRMWQLTPDLLGVLDRRGYFVRTNPAWQTLLGWTAAEIAEISIFDLIHPDDVEQTRASFAQLSAGKTILRFDNRYRAKSGKYRWFAWFGVPEGDEFFCSARDITFEKATAIELAARTLERDRVWDNSRDLLLIGDVQGNFIATNPAWQTLLGWEPDELIGINYLDLIHPDDIGGSADAHDRAATVGLEPFENRFRHRDGSYRWFAWIATPEAGNVYAAGRHITADKASASAFEAAQARLRAVFASNFQLQGILDSKGCVIDINPTALAIVGTDLSAVIGKKFWSTPWFSATAGVADLVRADVMSAAGGSASRREITVKLPGGTRTYDFTVRPISDPHGAIIGIVPEALDITDRRNAEAALLQSQKLEAMGQLTGGVAHDFNNLLTPIIGGLDLLQRRGIGGDRERRLIAGAIASAERARVLVQRLLAFARRQPLQQIAVDLSDLIAGLSDLIASTVGPHIKLVLQVDPGLPRANAEVIQLEMALLNLCVNARDAMPSGGRLGISLGMVDDTGLLPAGLEQGEFLCLSVSDTGTGMDAATLARAVEPFFSTKGVGKGTGLGLSMVHGLAAQLGGALTIDSQPGSGTTVALWLPVSHAVVVPPISRVVVPRQEYSGVVLLVDDEELVRIATAAMLGELGFEVHEVASGAEALAQIDAGLVVDLLITDHLMPNMTGVQLARAVQARQPTLPILIISGFAEGDGIAPDLPRLTKPFHADELFEGIAALMAA